MHFGSLAAIVGCTSLSVLPRTPSSYRMSIASYCFISLRISINKHEYCPPPSLWMCSVIHGRMSLSFLNLKPSSCLMSQTIISNFQHSAIALRLYRVRYSMLNCSTMVLAVQTEIYAIAITRHRVTHLRIVHNRNSLSLRCFVSSC